MDKSRPEPTPAAPEADGAPRLRGEWLPPKLHYFRAGDASIGSGAGGDAESTS